MGFSLWVCPTFGVVVQQNRKSPSTVLTAHNNRTFMCNRCCVFYFWCSCFCYRIKCDQRQLLKPLKPLVYCCILCCSHTMLSFLSSLPISVLRILDTEANKFYDRNHQLYDAALLTRCYTQHALRPFIDSEINHKRHFIKIPFINKGIEFIDLPSIFKDRSVTSSIPSYFQNSEPPIICYKYNKPIRNTVFNFNKLVSDLDIHANTPESWDCKDSKFIYPAAGHIMTGNLKIISDSRIRYIVSKGPKYRFPSRINFKTCREEIASAINDFGNRWCKREYVEPDAVKEWKVSIFKIVDQRIKFYSQNTNLLPPKPKSTFRHLKQGIQDFHRKYVLVPADKAANNVVVVWRLHYINTLKQEISGTKAYKETSEEEKSVVNGHCNHSALKFSVYVKERQDSLPTMYWLPKLHKKRIKHDLLQTQVLVLQLNFLNY